MDTAPAQFDGETTQLNITVPAGAAEAKPDAAAVGVHTVPVDAGPDKVKLGIVSDAACALKRPAVGTDSSASSAVDRRSFLITSAPGLARALAVQAGQAGQAGDSSPSPIRLSA
jgi:hypothetical protein